MSFEDFDIAPLGSADLIFADAGEVSETDSDVKVTAELPGLEEKEVEIQLANGVLAIKGEKKTETEYKDRRFSAIILSKSLLSSSLSNCRPYINRRRGASAKM